MLNTQTMLDAIVELDPSGKYKSISYNRTTDNSLPQSWWLISPTANWENYPKDYPTPSPLEGLLADGANDAIIATGKTDSCFIDILSFAPSGGKIFDDPNVQPTVAQIIADYINILPISVTPIIRYVIGTPYTPTPQQPKMPSIPSQDDVVTAFLKPGMITHPKAVLYWANFSPSFIPSSHMAIEGGNSLNLPSIGSWLEKIIAWLLNKIKEKFHHFYEIIKKWAIEIKSIILKYIDEIKIPQTSWNHSKIFAMNGYSLVSGGMNYWSLYQTHPSQTVTDISMRINGGAAVDAHMFADYFWAYLNDRPETDRLSWSIETVISTNTTTTCTNAPMYNGGRCSAGNLNALSVARNGNWPTHNGYPVQIFDAVRDLFLNILAVGIEEHVSSHWDLTSWLTIQLSDDNMEFQQFMSDAGVNPSCWATRYARNFAIKNASNQIKLSQQRIVQNDGTESGPFMELVNRVNELFRLQSSPWNGYIWPYDVLVAMSYSLTTMSNNSRQDNSIEIVCSYYKEGWGDFGTSSEFIAKLTGIMNGMQLTGYIQPLGDISNIIKNTVTYNRVVQGTDLGNHCKVVIVDNSVCYIGSDNAYPSYNQEFGLWIDDSNYIDDFINVYWKGMWSNAVPNN